MGKIKKIFASLSLVTLPITSMALVSGNNLIAQSPEASQLLYKYNNKIYEDFQLVMQDFLLDNPHFIKNTNVIGDVNKAIIDYDRGLLNKDLLPEYDVSKIKPVYQSPTGKYTTSFQQAQEAQVNPAFTRVQLTDGFNNFFSLDKTSDAINSFKKQIIKGQAGLINLDAFNGQKSFYNPLSEVDYQLLKENVGREIRNFPERFSTHDDFEREWYVNNETVNELDDIFPNSQANLDNALNESLEQYNEMNNIYSTTNGYTQNSSLRNENNITGQNIDAQAQQSLNDYVEQEQRIDLNQPYDLKLVKTDDQVLNSYRADLEQEKIKIQNEQSNFETQEADLMMRNATQKTIQELKQKEQTSNLYVWDKKAWYRSNTNTKGRTYFTFNFDLKYGNDIVASTSKKSFYFSNGSNEISGETFYFNQNFQTYEANKKYYLELNCYFQNEAKLDSVYKIGEINLNNYLTWPANATNKKVRINKLYTDFHRVGEKRNWSHPNQFHSSISLENVKVYYSYKCQDNNTTKNIKIKTGKVFFNQEEINQIKNNLPYDDSYVIKNLIGDKIVAQYSLNNGYDWESLTSTSSKYFLCSWNWNDFWWTDPYISATIKMQNSLNDTLSLTNNVIKIPFEIIPNYEQEIGLIKQKQASLVAITFENPSWDVLNDFDPSQLIASNNDYIVLSYQSFMNIIRTLQNSKQSLYLLASQNKLVNQQNITIKEPFKININSLGSGFINLMANDVQIKNKANIQMVIDFQKLRFDQSFKQISKINFKWALKRQYPGYLDPNIVAPSFDFTAIKDASIKDDQLYAAFQKIAQEVAEKRLTIADNTLLRFLNNLTPSKYQNLITEGIALNNERIWKIERDVYQQNFIQLHDDLSQTYTLADFFQVVKQDSKVQKELVSKIIGKIEAQNYADFKNLIKKIELKKPENNLEKLAFNYLNTLLLYIHNGSINNTLPGDEKYQFPTLDHIFLANKEVQTFAYLVTNEYNFNGSLLAQNTSDTILKIYDLDPLSQVQLEEDKKVIIANFKPQKVIQIYNLDGQEISLDEKYFDTKDLTILNAQFEAMPKVEQNYVYYEGQANLIFNAVSMIYYLQPLGTNLTYYFKSFDDVWRYCQEYIKQFVQLIERRI